MNTPADLTLVLFDIDGTLLDTHGAGKRSFARAVEHVFGWQDDLGYIRFAGATDLDVLRQIAERHGHALRDADVDAVFARLPVELEAATRGAALTLFPGVRELVHTLAADPRVRVGLVTGNIESCARIKLACFDLHDHFVLGAFGHEHADRCDCARLALRRAAAALAPDQRIAAAFLIGDTPSDIAAARAIGATAFAVATGGYAADALRAAGADLVLDTLADTEAVLAAMGLRAPRG